MKHLFDRNETIFLPKNLELSDIFDNLCITNMIKQYRLYHLLFLKKIKLVNPLMGQPTFFFLYDF